MQSTQNATASNSRESMAIALTMEQWETVQGWLLFGTDYHMTKKAEVLANCKDYSMAAQLVAVHETAAEQAETVRKIIDQAIVEVLENETTES